MLVSTDDGFRVYPSLKTNNYGKYVSFQYGIYDAKDRTRTWKWNHHYERALFNYSGHNTKDDLGINLIYRNKKGGIPTMYNSNWRLWDGQ